MNYEQYTKGYNQKTTPFIHDESYRLGVADYLDRKPLLSEREFNNLFNPKRKIIGLGGLAGVGKSTLAKILVDDYGYKVHKFATPIKRTLLDLGLTIDQVDGKLKNLPCAKLNNQAPRQAMQSLGDWGRNIDSDFWVDRWLETLPKGNVVCDDVRFENEVQKIHDLSGLTCYLHGENKGDSDSHKSENVEISKLFETDKKVNMNTDLNALAKRLDFFGLNKGN